MADIINTYNARNLSPTITKITPTTDLVETIKRKDIWAASRKLIIARNGRTISAATLGFEGITGTVAANADLTTTIIESEVALWDEAIITHNAVKASGDFLTITGTVGATTAYSPILTIELDGVETVINLSFTTVAGTVTSYAAGVISFLNNDSALKGIYVFTSAAGVITATAVEFGEDRNLTTSQFSLTNLGGSVTQGAEAAVTGGTNAPVIYIVEEFPVTR